MNFIEECGVTVMSSDLEKSIRFYVDVLGMELIQNYGGHYAEIQAKNLKIGLHPTGDQVVPNSSTSVGLTISELPSFLNNLTEHGIKFTKTEDGPVTLYYFKDPDGNPMYALEPYSG